MVAGALVWALHFMAIYGFAALACARGFAGVRWLGIGVVARRIGVATVIALGALLLIVARALRGRAGGGFDAQITAGVAALAAVAIVWETLPAVMVPTCG